jgi:hypothetical protein
MGVTAVGKELKSDPVGVTEGDDQPTATRAGNGSV